MAFVTTETNAIRLAGFTPALLFVTGTYTSSAGGTGGLIDAGYTNSSGTLTAVSPATASIGGRSIVAFWTQQTTEDVTTPKIAIAYNSTLDRQEVTLTSAANGTGNYYMLCLDNGA